MRKLLTVVVAFVGILARLEAATITLQNGNEIRGTILQTNADGILLQCDYGTVSYETSAIRQIQEDSGPASASDKQTNASLNAIRDWKTIIYELSKEPWATHLQQIPATVIDKGVLKNVPYISFRCGEDYECNIYGDLDCPAGVEIGVYRRLLDDPTAKSNCVSFISHTLSRIQDQNTASFLDEHYKTTKHGDLTFELTLPADADSYGGWWISVYYPSGLDAARATDEEMKNIAVSRNPASGVISPEETEVARLTAPQVDLAHWTFTNTYGRVISNVAVQSSDPISVSFRWNDGGESKVFFTNLSERDRALFHYDEAKAERFRESLISQRRQASAAWSASELAKSRTPDPTSALSDFIPTGEAGGGGGGGSVYVRGYYRSNGTYVNSYSRSYPRR